MRQEYTTTIKDVSPLQLIHLETSLSLQINVLHAFMINKDVNYINVCPTYIYYSTDMCPV